MNPIYVSVIMTAMFFKGFNGKHWNEIFQNSNSGCVGDIDDIFSLYFSDFFLTLIIDLYKNF